MNSFVLQLLAFASFAVAMPAIDNGMDSHVFGPERVVTDFAVLSDSNTDNLPSDFTVCSSVTSGGAFTGPIAPFQLLHKNGEPWIGMLFMTNEKNITNQQIWLLVSSRLNLYFNNERGLYLNQPVQTHPGLDNHFLMSDNVTSI